MRTVIPPYLQKGDTVCILSTARKISMHDVQTFADILLAAGLKVQYGKTIGETHFQLAGSDNLRIEDFTDALHNNDVKAIVCARGGYGTNRIVDDIDLEPIKSNLKWICGFSDVTFLHSPISNLNVSSMHTAMPSTFNESSMDSFTLIAEALMGKTLAYEVVYKHEYRKQHMNGLLVGGNSSILFAQLGTPYQLKTAGKILFIEDLDEYVYHMDRQMIAFKQAGFFKEVSAVIVGGMSDMKDHEIPYGEDIQTIIKKNIPNEIPVLFNFPCGHIQKNMPLKLNYPTELRLTEEGYTLKQE